MKFWWQQDEWKPKPGGLDLSRRGFLGGSGAALIGALAAPYVVRSGILMPVRQLLKPTVIKKLQYTFDDENWFDAVRYVGPANVVLRPQNYKMRGVQPKAYRTIIEREWAPYAA